MGVFGEIEGMVSPPEGPLEVAQESIDRAKLGQSDAGFAATSDHALVLGADDLDDPEAPQSDVSVEVECALASHPGRMALGRSLYPRLTAMSR